MVATLLDSDVFSFADGGAGHLCDLGSAPNAGEWDILFVNSNTVVDDGGFDVLEDATNQQGAYILGRLAVGGEGSTITVVTSGDHPANVIWSRWGNIDAFFDAGSAIANNANATSLPASATGALPETDMLVLAFGALHNFDGTLATSPNWANDLIPLGATSSGTDGSSQAVVAFGAYKTDAGTVSEQIDSVTWTNAARNRYALWAAFTTVSEAPGVESDATTGLGLTSSAVGAKTAQTAAVAPLAVASAAAGAKQGTSNTATPAALASTAGAGKSVTTSASTGLGLFGSTSVEHLIPTETVTAAGFVSATTASKTAAHGSATPAGITSANTASKSVTVGAVTCLGLTGGVGFQPIVEESGAWTALGLGSTVTGGKTATRTAFAGLGLAAQAAAQKAIAATAAAYLAGTSRATATRTASTSAQTGLGLHSRVGPSTPAPSTITAARGRVRCVDRSVVRVR